MNEIWGTNVDVSVPEMELDQMWLTNNLIFCV